MVMNLITRDFGLFYLYAIFCQNHHPYSHQTNFVVTYLKWHSSDWIKKLHRHWHSHTESMMFRISVITPVKANRPSDVD